MPAKSIEIVSCPPALSRDALALAMSDLTPEQRRDFSPEVTNAPIEALVVALENGELRGAAWGQRQPGSTAILWPPRFIDAKYVALERPLVEAVGHSLDSAGIRMSQILLQDTQTPLATKLQVAGFARLTELLYLNWESAAFEFSPPASVEFEPYRDSEGPRLAALVERTYEATQDCPALGGQRPMPEVLDGYRATGVFDPNRWRFIRELERDVGVLLLTEHAAANHWELLYVGLVPAARGQRLGHIAVRHAQALAYASGAERIVLAVDADNFPAIKMYNETGFQLWDRRTVFVRFADRR